MRPTYIVGFDGSPHALAALEFTRELARRTGARVVAAHVYPNLAGLYATPYVTAAPYAGAAAGSNFAADAERLLEDIAGDVEPRAWAGTSVPRELHGFARDEQAALLAVGATHHSPGGRLLLGSVAERVVHGSPCPVLVVPQRDAGRTIQTIAVAYDGRTESRRALRAAESLATRLGASLRLVSAADVSLTRNFVLETAEELDEIRGSLLERAAVMLRRRGLDVGTWLVRGPAGPGVVQACDNGVDLLVAGSRDYGPVRSVMLGGASRYIVDHAPCPVLVVPRSAAFAVLTEPLAAVVES